jgi:glutathione S-transferase
MKLYISSGSPFARKVRVMLLEKKAPFDLEAVDLWAPSDYPRVNPVGKVPALELDDGRVLVNSPLIADYIDGRFPQPRLMPADPDQRLDARRWEALADATMDAAVASLYEARFHEEATRSKAFLERQRGKIDRGFAELERMLDGRPWCVGGAMSIADIAIACHVGFITARKPEFFPPERYPGLARLARDMGARESMKLTVPPPA